jgi:hypothetical protein
MPTEVGIRDLASSQQRKSWIPAFAGMTEWGQRRRVNAFGGWYQTTILTPVDPVDVEGTDWAVFVAGAWSAPPPLW